MARELFVDTSGFFSLLVKNDPQHALADQILRSAATKGRRRVTTDYVLDETATLLKARVLYTIAGGLVVFERPTAKP